MGCHLRDLNKREEWAHRNFMKFSKAKCNMFHLNWSKTQYQYRLRDESRFWECWWMRGWPWPCNVFLSPGSQSYPGLHQKQHGQQGEGILLFCFHETPSRVLHPTPEFSAEESIRKPTKIIRDGIILLWSQAEIAEVFSLKRSVQALIQPFHLQGAYKKVGDSFLVGLVEIGRVMVLS